jgi:hypothetical protein
MITTRPMTMADAAAYMAEHGLAASRDAAREVLRRARDHGSADGDPDTYSVDYSTLGKGGNNRGHFVLLVDEPGDIINEPGGPAARTGEQS